MRAATVIVPLAELLQVDSKVSGRCVRDALCGFTCERDGTVVEDVVDFIHNKAIPFEQNRVCRTFLAISEPDLSVGKLTVLGYFTLQYIQSRANDGSLDALDAELRQVIAANYDSTSGVLLVQLARDSRYSPEDLNGSTLLANAERQARLVCDYVGGELIYIDCSESMCGYYEDKGYIQIDEVPGEDGGESYFKMQKQLYPTRSPVLDALISDASA